MSESARDCPDRLPPAASAARETGRRPLSAVFATPAVILIILVLGTLSAAQTGEPARYTLTGDDVLIESYEGTQHLQARGNVLLTYSFDGESWALSARFVDFIQVEDENERPIQQIASAEGDLMLTGPDILLSAPGSMVVDILNRYLSTESPDTHLIFPGGELAADRLDIQETVMPGGVNRIHINTAERTLATYELGGEDLAKTVAQTSTESVFGSLDFDFSHITVETERTHLVLEDGSPVLLDCPDESVLTTAANRLTMPAFELTFDPPTLRAENGVQLEIGEETRVEAAALSLTYPPGGSMLVELSGYTRDDYPPSGVPARVVIYHPAGTFWADTISVRIDPDGCRCIAAKGHTMFEMPMGKVLSERSEAAQ